jgi:hypothetical protein
MFKVEPQQERGWNLLFPQKMRVPYNTKPLNPRIKRLRSTKHKQTVTEKVTDLIIIDI